MINAIPAGLRALCLGAALTLAGAAAQAQTFTPDSEIVQGLSSTLDAAPQVSVDVLHKLVLERINYSGPASQLPPLDLQLNKLAQINVQIQFDLNSAMIKPESYHTLGAIADAMHNPVLLGYKFLVVGNTDATGTRAINLKLSEERANAVVEALSTVFRVNPNRLAALGVGSEALQDTRNPDAAINRRVQIYNLGPAGPFPKP